MAIAFAALLAGCAGTGENTVTTPFLECMKRAETAENRRIAMSNCHYDQIARRSNSQS